MPLHQCKVYRQCSPPIKGSAEPSGGAFALHARKTACTERGRRGQLAGSTVLGSEDSGSRMSRLGHAELESGRFTSTDELLQKIRAVTLEDVHGLARYLGQQQMITTIVR